MTKFTPNKISKLANTECLIFLLVLSSDNSHLSEIANTVCLIKPLFNDKMYTKLSQ